MKRVWIAVLSLAAAATFTTPAGALPPPACLAPNSTFTVNTGNQALVANGFDCSNVNLVIESGVNITPTVETLKFNAKTITINAATIDNNFNSSSNTFITAEGGGIAVTGATIRANDHLILECKAAQCTINIQNSVIKSPINPLLTTGDTRAIANGDITVENSTFFGKQKVGLFSQSGKVTWHCGTSVDGCQDPLTSGVSQTLCPGGFPCQVTFANPAALHAVCFPGGNAVDCGGGESECQVNAFLDVDLINSTIVCNSHFGVTSKTGSIFMAGANITAKDALTFQAFKGIFAADSTLTSLFGAVTLDVKGGIPAGQLCIDVKNADITKPRVFSANNGCLVDTTGLTPP